MPDLLMPRLVEHMEQGVVARWLRDDGDDIDAGDEVVEIETDKATTVIESEYAGVLHIIAPAGDAVAVGKPIATVGQVDAAVNGSRADGESQRQAGERSLSNGDPSEGSPASGRGWRHRASPVARRIARERRLSLDGIAGSGPHGRVLKVDVLRAADQALAVAAVEGQPASGPPVGGQSGAARTLEPPPPSSVQARPAEDGSPARARGETVAEELTMVQRRVAARMAEAKATVPDFAVSAEVDMSSCLKLRDELREQVTAEEVAPSINDFIVKASARALRAFPRANGSYGDERFELHGRVNIGVAVASEGSLIVPTVFDADRLSLAEIARQTRRLAAAARDGRISPAELAGGTFTVSNLGMFGVSSFTAIVNPPQACILAVGAIVNRAVVVDAEIVPRPIMIITLASDHRIIYGADAARLLALIREGLERPLSLAL